MVTTYERIADASRLSSSTVDGPSKISPNRFPTLRHGYTSTEPRRLPLAEKRNRIEPRQALAI